MQINKITIKNFRNIENETTFYLNPKFTVIIGINGKGKSTILHALRVACGAFFLAIPEVKKYHIRPDEIRQKDVGKLLNPVKPVKIEAEGIFSDSKDPVIWRRQILEHSNVTTSNEQDVGAIRNIGKRKYELITKEANDKINLPVIAFFSTSRAYGAGKTKTSRIGRQIFKEGYQDWSEMKLTSFKYESWLASYEVLKKGGKEYGQTKKAFLAALKKANRFIKEIEVINGKLWFKVEIEGTVSDMLPIELHSDGIRFFTEMVAELSYRCIVLNGYLDAKAIEQSRGVVMIDELDLHLHPNWQRHVVSDLKDAFPNIQFVVTSHSPFIVQSLESDEIWNLDKSMDISPKDLKIDTIATKVMGVPSPYSADNEEEYLKSKNFLTKLEQDSSKEELEKDLDEISDPGVRAFLELSKMSKGK